jgi:signal transduction histidine kinase
MSFDVRSYMLNRISGQIVALVIASMIVSHIVLAISFIFYRHEPPERFGDHLATLVELIAANPIERREALVAASARAFPRFELALATGPPAVAPARSFSSPELEGFAHRLGPRYHVIPLAAAEPPTSGAGGQRVAIDLQDGEFVTARLAPMPSPPLFGPFTITWLAVAISVPLLGLWAALGLTGPLRRFAQAAENFDPNDEFAPVPERGPREIRVAARALNQMRERIKALIDDRTRLLAAVSHDLRTPITRLRLQCEFIDDEGTRAKMLGELAHMQAMVESVLHFLRDGRTGRQAIALDLATSLQAICDQFTDSGHNVSYYGPDHVVIRARPEDLHRAITNLIDNAVRHGSKVDVRLALTSPTVTIAIEDDGPGIPGAGKEAMFEPFVRGDAARGMDNKTGFGLGLSIARAAIEAHHGTLTLLDREPHGLVAQVILPQRDETPAATPVSRPH